MTINRIEVVIRNYRILRKNLVGTKKVVPLQSKMENSF